MEVSTIGIVGAGAIGSALGALLADAGYKVFFWDQEATRRTATTIETFVGHCQVIILCIPSWANAEVAGQIAAVGGDAKRLVLSVSKGVGEGFVTMDEVLSRASQGRFDVGLMYGPMLAEELLAGAHAAAVVAVDSDWHDVLKAVPAERLTLVYSSDQKSVALCGALKNIYALAFGIHDGLNLGYNSKGILTVQAVYEMKRIVGELGAQPETVDGLAGLGDLLATGWSAKSFNYRIGKALAEGILDEEHAKGEGVRAVKEASQALQLSNYPVMQAVYAIVHQNSAAKELRKAIGLS